ncbi:MAG TPA: hypothetical protein PL059_02800 [Spirochaetota bacterium]|nr:hypothetical protein [Spirochaetota bacterium]HOM09028.1 hypothetical protein [Spirochaetota bacterium]HPP48842.1 hypothetical protein [Spirochaetota bacterium]HXK66384.1 hypothetical protein [Spirochaetota bacterium]
MQHDVISRGRQYIKSFAVTLPAPRFYADSYWYLAIAKKISTVSSVIAYCAGCMRQKGSALGHSYYHAEKVAIESAAIVLKEKGISSQSIHLAMLALIAGFLHDYYREKKDHPAKAAEYVQAHLSHFMPESDIDAISFAIRNHEAFKEYQMVDNSDIMLLSNALYDADKFRWGPDNFIYTIWDMIATMNIPIQDIIAHFPGGVAHINSIRYTFRSKTGMDYGPEFIDQGMLIAEKLLQFLQNNS